MNSTEDVYNELKKYDTENKLTLSDDRNGIELEVNNYKIVAFDDYISVATKGVSTSKQITHWHPNDYNEMYHDLLGILKERIDLKYISEGQLRTNWKIIITTIIALIFFGVFELGSFFSFILVILFFILFNLLIIGIKKLIIFMRIKLVNKEDMELVKKYVKMSYPPYTHDLCMDLTFDYIGMVSSEFLKYPKKIRFPYPLEFCNEEIIKIEKITKHKEKDKDAEELYGYYQASQDVIKIICKYYYKNGVRKS